MPNELIKHVVIPGTFDPVTLGHMDVIKRSARLFPQITVAVAASVGKGGTGPAFSLEERVELLEDAIAAEGLNDCVEVRAFTGLLVDFCHEIGASAVIKGLRALTDFEYELQQAQLNAYLGPDIESIFVMSSQSFGYVSSSMVRELANMGSDVSFLVPPNVCEALKAHYAS